MLNMFKYFCVLINWKMYWELYSYDCPVHVHRLILLDYEFLQGVAIVALLNRHK